MVVVAVAGVVVVGSLIMPTNANETIRERYQREHNEYVSSLERQVESLKGSCDSWSNRMVKKVTEANKIIEAQAAEIADQLSRMDRLLKTIRYMEGIAAKGEGRELREIRRWHAIDRRGPDRSPAGKPSRAVAERSRGGN